ncbi:MAG TPA: hypothetical protein VKM93_07385 [Terriglobia bacterium]|nr:hypothetical protein [Terriglobia bacterium]
MRCSPCRSFARVAQAPRFAGPNCPARESIPGKVSAAWVQRAIRVRRGSILMSRRLYAAIWGGKLAATAPAWSASIILNDPSGTWRPAWTERFDVTRERVHAVLGFVARRLDRTPVLASTY